MRVLIDTNVLVLSVNLRHPQREEAIGAIEKVVIRGDTPCVFFQNVAEFWNVCTRLPDQNGLGLSPSEAERHLAELESEIAILDEPASVYRIWRDLLVRYGVRGVQVHDARLAAGMLSLGIRQILTYNLEDFRRFEGILALHPRHADRSQ